MLIALAAVLAILLINSMSIND